MAFLKPRKESRTNRRASKKHGFDNRARENALRTLTHRIRPLLPHASAVTALIGGASLDSEVKAALDLLTKDVSLTESYPYRDRPRYIATVCFPLLFKTVDALDALTPTTAIDLANWLVKSPIGHHHNTMYVTARLATNPATRDAALALAHHIAKPTQNARVESFHGRLREECLSVSWFQNLFDARRKIAAWRTEYNEERPHSSLGYKTPKEFAAAEAAAFYSAERGARNSNAVPCPSRSPIPAYTGDGAAESCRILT